VKRGRELTHEYRKFYDKLGFRVNHKGNVAGVVRDKKVENIRKGNVINSLKETEKK